MTSRPVSVRVRVRGRVQGVGFRWATQGEAARLGWTRWGRNVAADGSVECRLQGAREVVDVALAWLREGPPGARVEGLDVDDVPWDETLTGFEIRPTLRD